MEKRSTGSFTRRLPGAAQGVANPSGSTTKAGPNGTVLVSTGISDLDKIIGGGVPIGGILMVMEDLESPHHLSLLRYFMAQGVVHGQPILYGSSLASPKAFLGTLPAVLTTSDRAGSAEKNSEVGEALRIAWQYRRYLPEQQALDEKKQKENQRLSKLNLNEDLHGSSLEWRREYTSTFDLRKTIDKKLLAGAKLTCLSLDASISSIHSQFVSFLTESPGSTGEVHRIALHSLGAPQCLSGSLDWGMLSLLVRLKSLLRLSNAVAIITYPAALLHSSFNMRWQHLADILVSIEVAQEEAKNMETILTDYQSIIGFLHVQKLPSLNSQVPAIPNTRKYAIKAPKRKEIVLEPLHLAPVSVHEGSNTNGATVGACGSQIHDTLDF